jgi:hypothetical protein
MLDPLIRSLVSRLEPELFAPPNSTGPAVYVASGFKQPRTIKLRTPKTPAFAPSV